MSLQYTTAAHHNVALVPGTHPSEGTEPRQKPVPTPVQPEHTTSISSSDSQNSENSDAARVETQKQDSHDKISESSAENQSDHKQSDQSSHSESRENSLPKDQMSGNSASVDDKPSPNESDFEELSVSRVASSEAKEQNGQDSNQSAASDPSAEMAVPFLVELKRDSTNSSQKRSQENSNGTAPPTANAYHNGVNGHSGINGHSEQNGSSPIDVYDKVTCAHTDDNSSSAAADRRRWGSTINGDNHTCANCGTTETPLWRRGPNDQVLCNACGLYIKARNIHRPITLKRSPLTKVVSVKGRMGSCPGDGRCNGTGGSQSCSRCPSFINNSRRNGSQLKHESSDQNGINMVSCQNCGTVNTPLWRRDVQGHIICNACGLYNRMHKDARPADLQSAIVRRRKRIRPNSHDSHSFDEHSHSEAGSPSGQTSPQNSQSTPAHSPPAHSPALSHQGNSPPSSSGVSGHSPPASTGNLPKPEVQGQVGSTPKVHYGNHELCCQHLNPTIENASASPAAGFPQPPTNLPHQPPVPGFQQQFYPPPSHSHPMPPPYGFVPMHLQPHMQHPQQYVNQYNQAHPSMPLPQPPSQAPHGIAPLPLPQPHIQPPPAVVHQQPPQQPKQREQSHQTSESKSKQEYKDSDFSPLSVLRYLSNASNDTKKEYLLAARRQLNDRMEDLRSKMKSTEAQLGDCERALEEFNQ